MTGWLSNEQHVEIVGFPTIMYVPLADFMFELLLTPEQTVLVSTDGTVRHIYTDGRSHPKPEDLWPTPVGDSIGHWEGTTLVVDTLAREPGGRRPRATCQGAPLCEAARLDGCVAKRGGGSSRVRRRRESGGGRRLLTAIELQILPPCQVVVEMLEAAIGDLEPAMILR